MTVISSLPVREVVGAPVDDDGGWPFSMGAVAQVLRDGLALSELTVLVGENGVGKSTLIEAVAMAYGLSAEGAEPEPHRAGADLPRAIAWAGVHRAARQPTRLPRPRR